MPGGAGTLVVVLPALAPLPLVNGLKVRTRILGRGPLVRTFTQIFLGRRFETISIFWFIS